MFGSLHQFKQVHRKLFGIESCSYWIGGISTCSLCSVPSGPSVANALTSVVYLHSDHLGSVSMVTDQGGNVASQQQYDPWGKVRSGGVTQTKLNYTGQRKDDTGLLYSHARYYDPSLARFMSPDSIVPGTSSGVGGAGGSVGAWQNSSLTVDFHESGYISSVSDENTLVLKQGFWTDQLERNGPTNSQALNRYSYGLGNPVKYVDPTGHGVDTCLPNSGCQAPKSNCVGYGTPNCYRGEDFMLTDQPIIPASQLPPNLGAAMRAKPGLTPAGLPGQKTKFGKAITDPSKGRFDFETDRIDDALYTARQLAGDLGENTRKMYDPKTGILIGEMSADGKRGWRIDSDHVNYWNWSGGKKGTGGMYGHIWVPKGQIGPHSEHIGYADYVP
jgi:RHS repeat-associated protein